MHSMVGDATQLTENNETQIIRLNNKNQKATVELKKNIKYLVFEGKIKDVFSCKPEGFKLEFLKVSMDKEDEDNRNAKNEVPNSFFKNITGLREFHLFYDHYPHKLSLSLPQSIQLLKNIQSLFFKCVDLGNISILGNLQSLEKLDLKDCKIDELPHEITKLEKFRLLKLEGGEIKTNNPFKVIEECSSLEELYFTGCFNVSCQEIAFPKLQKFCIDESVSIVNDSSSSPKYVSILDKDGIFLSETTLKYCMQTAEVLRLRRIEREWRNLIPEIVSMNQGMKDMVELSLSCISQLQYLINTKHTNFQEANVMSKLVVLKLDRMDNLEELFNGPISPDWLKNLEKLSIKDCKNLQNLFKFKLNLWKLKVIDIEGCHILESIFPFLFVKDLPALETIKIRRCEQLKYIFGKYHYAEFNSLRQLELFQLPSFMDMFCKYNHPISSLPEKGSSSTSNYDSKAQLPLDLDPVNCNIVSLDTTTTTFSLVNLQESNSYCLNIWGRAQCLQIPSKILRNIKKIELSHFSEIKSVFIPSIAATMLLETLTIRNCEKLKNIIDFGDYGSNNWYNVFPKMKELCIEGCPKMEYIFGHYTDDHHQNHVEFYLKLRELKCLILYNLPNLVAMCPKHYQIMFPALEKCEPNKCSPAAMKSLSHFKIIQPAPKNDKKEEDGDGQIAKTESVITTQPINGKTLQKTNKINVDKDSQNDNAVMKVSLNIEVQFHKGIPNRTKLKATSKGKQELVVKVPGNSMVPNLPTNSKMDQQHHLGEIGTAVTPSHVNN